MSIRLLHRRGHRPIDTPAAPTAPTAPARIVDASESYNPISIHRPTGGFPSIYEIDPMVAKSKYLSKNRNIESLNTGISIKTIMTNKKK